MLDDWNNSPIYLKLTIYIYINYLVLQVISSDFWISPQLSPSSLSNSRCKVSIKVGWVLLQLPWMQRRPRRHRYGMPSRSDDHGRWWCENFWGKRASKKGPCFWGKNNRDIFFFGSLNISITWELEATEAALKKWDVCVKSTIVVDVFQGLATMIQLIA